MSEASRITLTRWGDRSLIFMLSVGLTCFASCAAPSGRVVKPPAVIHGAGQLIVAQRIEPDPNDPSVFRVSGQKDVFLASDGTIAVLWIWEAGSGENGSYEVQLLGEEPKRQMVSIRNGTRTRISLDISGTHKRTGITFRRYSDGVLQEEHGVTILPTSP